MRRSLSSIVALGVLIVCARLAYADGGTSPTAWLGAASCSARACHGDAGLRVHPLIWGTEHSIWHEHDPHHRAYAVLLEPAGQEIARRLNLKVPAQEARQCLVCHAPAAMSAVEVLGAACVPSPISEGVGCEACHGPAERWITAHTTADWSALTPQEKQQHYGLENLKDLTARARKCAGCHVGMPDLDGDGAPDADVNHDLIAAGHPRLAFELSSYLHRYPRHWDEKGENDRRLRPDFEARAWSVGQLVTAEAQLQLLAARAAAAAANHPKSVWPELAEYSCYACHRSVSGVESPSPAVAGMLGKPAWGTWHFPLLPLVDAAPADAHAQLEALRAEMKLLAADPAAAARQARETAALLHGWLSDVEGRSYTEPALRAQLFRLAAEGPALVDDDWDGAAQLYLALAAWQQSRLDVQQRVRDEDRAIQRLLGQGRQELLSPEQFIRSRSDAAQMNMGEGPSWLRQLRDRVRR